MPLRKASLYTLLVLHRLTLQHFQILISWDGKVREIVYGFSRCVECSSVRLVSELYVSLPQQKSNVAYGIAHILSDHAVANLCG